MLTLRAGQAETLWDEALPIEVRELPWDLAQLDVLLGGEELFAPIVEHWRREVLETGRSVLTEGRPTIAIETYVRLMVLRTRYRWGVPDVDGGGLGLDSFAALLPDRATPRPPRRSPAREASPSRLRPGELGLGSPRSARRVQLSAPLPRGLDPTVTDRTGHPGYRALSQPCGVSFESGLLAQRGLAPRGPSRPPTWRYRLGDAPSSTPEKVTDRRLATSNSCGVHSRTSHG